MNLTTLKAGPQIDSLIARKLWNAIVVTDNEDSEIYMFDLKTQKRVSVPKFSSIIEDANSVVELLQNKGWFFRIQSVPQTDQFYVAFFKEDGNNYPFYAAETIPLAICIAALSTANKYKI